MKQKIYIGLLSVIATLLTAVSVLLAMVIFRPHATFQQAKVVDQPGSVIETAVSESENQAAPVELVESEPMPVVLTGLPQRETPKPYQPVEGEVRLRSVGDVLIHEHISNMASVEGATYIQAAADMREAGLEWDAPAEGYDFVPIVSPMMPYLRYADISVANLEIPVAYPQLPIQDYPQFNAPRQVLDALKYIGIDIVSNATNHTIDMGSEGIYASIENLRRAGMEYYGSFDSAEDRARPRIIEKNGLKIGFLSYSYGTNGLYVPEDEPYLVNLIDLPLMEQEVRELKQQADAVVVSLQVGPEYDVTPDDEQRTIFQGLSDAGADLILGGHPHVLQQMSWINDNKTFAIYSQASFISGQVEDTNKQGGITEVTFKRMEDGTVKVVEPKFMPIYMVGEYYGAQYKTIPLADYTRYGVWNGADWWERLKERMTSKTTDFDFVSHLETEWTMEAKDTFRD